MKKHIPRDFLAYKNLPFSERLTERAKRLRKAGNLPEVVFWNRVKRKRFMGLDFDRQKIVGNYIVDFYCANCKLVVEIDGSSHYYKKEYDLRRDDYLRSLGLVVVHFTVKDVMRDISGVMGRLKGVIEAQCVVTVPGERMARATRVAGANMGCGKTTPSSPAGRRPPLQGGEVRRDLCTGGDT